MNNFQVGDDNRLPRYLCTDCYKRCLDWKVFLDLVHESNDFLKNDFVPSEVIVKEEPVNISDGEIRENHCLVNQEYSRVDVKEEPVLEFFETEIYQGEIPNNNQDIKEEYEMSEPIMKEAEAMQDNLSIMCQETPNFKAIPNSQPEMGEGQSTAFRQPRNTPTPLPTTALPPSTSPTPAITTPWSYDNMKALVKNSVEEGKG